MKSLDELKSMFEKVFGYPLKPLTPPEVLGALRKGPQDIVMVLAWDEAQQAHVVVSALGLGPEWAVGEPVDADVARRARPLT